MLYNNLYIENTHNLTNIYWSLKIVDILFISLTRVLTNSMVRYFLIDITDIFKMKWMTHLWYLKFIVWNKPPKHKSIL